MGFVSVFLWFFMGDENVNDYVKLRNGMKLIFLIFLMWPYYFLYYTAVIAVAFRKFTKAVQNAPTEHPESLLTKSEDKA